MVPDLIIRTITMDETGVSIEYVQPAQDIKANGVQMNHVLFIPRNDDYDDEILDLEEKALYLVRDVLEDVPDLPGIKNRTPDEDED